MTLIIPKLNNQVTYFIEFLLNKIFRIFDLHVHISWRHGFPLIYRCMLPLMAVSLVNNFETISF